MNNRFILDIDKGISKLSGNSLGREIYDTQVKGKIDFDSKMIFIFPDQIDFLASSFIQGFFNELVKKIGIDGIETLVEVQSRIPCINDLVKKSLLSKEGV